MASTDYKMHKTDLISLYRLEFYKKKSNWKLACDTKKKHRSMYTKTRKMNETYDIEKGEHSLLNTLDAGFLDEVPDRDVGSTSPMVSQPVFDELAHGTPWSEMLSEPERDVQEWRGAELDMCDGLEWEAPPTQDEEVCAAGGATIACLDAVHNLPSDGELAEQCMADSMQLDDLANDVESFLNVTNAPADMHDEQSELDSSEEFAQFFQGAHNAPHSSETDLREEEDLRDSPPCVSVGGVHGEAQLWRHARDCIDNLHALMHEAAARDTRLHRKCWSELMVGLVGRGRGFGPCAPPLCAPGRGRARLHVPHVGMPHPL